MKSRILILLLLISFSAFSCKQKPAAPAEQPVTAVATAGGQKMIIAKVAIKPENVEDFIKAAQSIIKSSNEEEGCIDYQLFQSPYEKTSFVFVEKYVNQAAIDFHFAQPYFSGFGNTISGWTQGPAEIMIYDIAGERKAD